MTKIKFGTVWVLISMLSAFANACELRFDSGERDLLDGPELLQPDYWRAYAGGGVRLAECDLPMWRGEAPFGHTTPGPYFTFTVEELEGFTLQIRTVSNCDTTLLVNGASEEWYFNDDDGEGTGPLVNINPADNGRYDVWLGTVGEQDGLCESMVVLETFML